METASLKLYMRFAGPAVELEDGISLPRDILDDKNVDIHSQHVEISHLETDCDQIENKSTAKLAATMEIKDQVISQVTADRDLRAAELEKIYCSRGWRMLKMLYRIESFLIPPNSRRRLFARIVLNAVRHPIAYAKKLKPSSIRNFVAAVKQDGLENASLKLDRFEATQGILSRTRIDRYDMKRTVFAPINFPAAESPSVSIIIPVYNHFSYTYGCLEAILANTTDVSYEIVIADDCSTDRTAEIGKLIGNISVSRTPNNLGFLGNCNHAAKMARGQYIHFLNNDTNVQKGWLGSLIRLMEENPQIGMTGSKLVYADGRLQEAGGILWQDGHAWNYGRLGNADEPEFNYVKEVDYISGASILIRQSLWAEIGGFDTRYTPAYYEDTDLAFEVRRHGYKVVYQPASVVIHYEGVSNGTDTGSGLKAYQEKNFVKFREKWADTLQAEHLSGPDFLFQARDRSRNRKHILVIDHYVPHYDQDAGSKCTFMYIRLFVKLGMQVTFLGDNFYPHEPYTSAFQQMGVEVLYGNRYANGWKQWIRQNGRYFDYAYLNRPHIAVKYIDFIKTNSSAKIIYFGQDLHYLREQRQYEIEKDPALLSSSREWKKKEFDLIRKADVVYVVGSYELGVLQKEFPLKTIRNIPVYFYEEDQPKNGLPIAQRKDLLFVGGFSHLPNVDAVLWFVKDIFPAVQKVYPEIRLLRRRFKSAGECQGACFRGGDHHGLYL